MIKSMTGFGKAEIQLPNKKITIEIKSLNSKNLDINARISSGYREKELDMRTAIANKLVRGKIDFGLYLEITGEETTSKINQGIVEDYMNQLKAIVDGDALKLLEMAIRLPDALKVERQEIDEKEFSEIQSALETALEKIDAFRIEEGNVLEQDFKTRIATIKTLLEEVKKIDPERAVAIRERLNKAIAELTVDKDENRFEQELIYYLEKYDVTEEKVRLENHLNYFLKSLNSNDSNGKKLGFICQEIGREINTLGSKANYAPMQQIVVRMKDELEKIKEQLLNVL